MKLYTTQPIEVWNKLQEQKILIADAMLGEHIDQEYAEKNGFSIEDDSFYAAYSWMKEQMEHRIPGYQGNWPWWAWTHKIDIRSERHLYPKGEEFVMIELEIPDEKVLCSCFEGWHSVLNRRYLAKTMIEEAKADQEWMEITNMDTDPEKPKISLYQLRKYAKGEEPWPETIEDSPEKARKKQEYKEKQKRTWENIFDIEWMKKSQYEGGDQIQACFEELNINQVIKAKMFKGARKS
jgi:hypothetical protein